MISGLGNRNKPSPQRYGARGGGRKPAGFQAYSYVDARDLAAAFQLAFERSIPRGTILFVVADDSTTADPLCDLYSRLMPSGDKAYSLTGGKGPYPTPAPKHCSPGRPFVLGATTERSNRALHCNTLPRRHR
jgi:hypothetical protein